MLRLTYLIFIYSYQVLRDNFKGRNLIPEKQSKKGNEISPFGRGYQIRIDSFGWRQIRSYKEKEGGKDLLSVTTSRRLIFYFLVILKMKMKKTKNAGVRILLAIVCWWILTPERVLFVFPSRAVGRGQTTVDWIWELSICLRLESSQDKTNQCCLTSSSIGTIL